MPDGFTIEAKALLEVLQAQQTQLRATVQALTLGFEPNTAQGKGTGPLSMALDLRGPKGRLQLEVWVKSSGPATFTVEGSADGDNWRLVDTITLVAAGESHQGYMNAYPVVRVSTTAPGENEIEIVAAR